MAGPELMLIAWHVVVSGNMQLLKSGTTTVLVVVAHYYYYYYYYIHIFQVWLVSQSASQLVSK